MAVLERGAAELAPRRAMGLALQSRFTSIVIKGCLSDPNQLHKELEETPGARRVELLRTFPDLQIDGMLAACAHFAQVRRRGATYQLLGGFLAHEGGGPVVGLPERPIGLRIPIEGTALCYTQRFVHPPGMDWWEAMAAAHRVDPDLPVSSYLSEPGDIELIPWSIKRSVVAGPERRSWHFYFGVDVHQPMGEVA